VRKKKPLYERLPDAVKKILGGIHPEVPLVPYEWQEVGMYCGESVVATTAPVATVALAAGGAVAVPHTHNTSLLAFV
jgi:hypothetical protein